MFDPYDFGAVGDGVADDTAAVQAAYDAAAEVGGSVVLTRGIFNIPGNLIMGMGGVSLLGQGGTVTGGEVRVGPVSYGGGSGGVNFSGTRIRGVTFDRRDPNGTSRCLVLRNVRGLDIEKNHFRNCGGGIAVTTADGNTTFHTVSMLSITGNRFTTCAFGVYANTVEWDRLSDWTIDNNFFNYASDTSIWIAGPDGANSGGVDGLTLTNNTMFSINYNSSTDPRFAKKRYNVRLGQTDWLSIKGNKFFEAGLSALHLAQPRHVDIIGNHFAWPGEREQADCIEIQTSAGGFTWGTIEGNVFDWWTRAAIGVYGSGDVARPKIGKNAHRWSATPDSWKGAGTLTINNCYRYFVDSATIGRPVVDEWDAPGCYDSIKGSNRVSGRQQMSDYGGLGGATRRATTVTAGTPLTVFLLTDVGESTTYNGLIVVQARSGSLSTSNATYALLVESGSRTVLPLGVVGKTSGATATDPAFTWTIDGSNGLVATPVGSTAGLFFFDVTTVGAIGAR